RVYRSIGFGLQVALGLRLEGELLLQVWHDSGDAPLDELAHQRPERRFVRTLGQEAERHLEAAHVGTPAAVRPPGAVVAERILHEERRVDAGAARAERAVDAVVD